MRISKIDIRNFRGVKEANLSISPYQVLVGEDMSK